MKKVLLTEQQLAMLVNYIDETENKKEVLEEGWKDVALGVLMLMGVGLTGANAQTAKNALNDEQTLKKIEQTLETPQIEQLAKTLEEKGLNNAMDLIQNNANTIINAYNKAAEKKKVNFKLTKVYNTASPTAVKSKLKQGYAVQDIQVIKDTIVQKKGDVQMATDLELSFDANIFNTGTFDLTDSIKAEIQGSVESITMLGGKITGIEIYSSTDKEPIKMGNAKLAKLRADGVAKFLTSLGVEVTPTIETTPEQGPDVYSRTMSPEDRAQARTQTAEFRYVKVVIHSIVEPAPQEEESVIKVVERVKYSLVKGYNTGDVGTVKISGKKHFKSKKFKCKKLRLKDLPPIDCEFFD